MTNPINSTYIYIIRKDSLQGYEKVAVPDYYTGTIRDESKMGYTVLAYALEQHSVTKFNPSTIQTTASGKPFIEGLPLHFNISHSTDYVACAISNDEVGIDIEQSRTIQECLHSKILTAKERIDTVDALQAWVMKEAYSKYLGVGTALSFSAVSVEQISSQQPHVYIANDEYTCVVFYGNAEMKVEILYSIDRV